MVATETRSLLDRRIGPSRGSVEAESGSVDRSSHQAPDTGDGWPRKTARTNTDGERNRLPARLLLDDEVGVQADTNDDGRA